MTNDWKERVRPILQLFVDRLPGALLEEKEFSLAWHYRRADPEQASLRAKELLDDLTGYTRNIDVQVFEGNKVIEVRNCRRQQRHRGAGMAFGPDAGIHPGHRRRLDGRGFVPRPAADRLFRARRRGQHRRALFIWATTPPCGGCCGNCPIPPAARRRNHEAGAPDCWRESSRRVFLDGRLGVFPNRAGCGKSVAARRAGRHRWRPENHRA